MQRLFNKNQKGFSMVEAVMASGLVAAVALISISIGRLSTNSNIKITNNGDVEALTTEIKSLLKDPINCNANLNRPGSNAAVGFNVGNLIDTNGVTRFIETDTYNFLQLNTLDVEAPGLITSTFVTSPGIGFVNLVATWLPTKVSPNSRLITSKIRLWVETNILGEIVNCSSISLSENNLWRRSYSDAKDLIYMDGAVSAGVESSEARLVVEGKIKADLSPGGSGLEMDPGDAGGYYLNLMQDQKIVFSNTATGLGIDTTARDANLTGELVPTPFPAMGCTASTVGLMRVNTTYKVLQYCRGGDNRWIDLDEI